MSQLILFNKPFNVLCQFSDTDSNCNIDTSAPRETLKDFLNIPDIYPAGRLDRDSEGLLLLTDDGKLQQAISHPRFKLEKSYLVQVEGEIDESALQALRQGVLLNDGPTLPASAETISDPDLWQRCPAIRVRKNIPDSWLRLTIKEGRNRQVRRMTAAAGFPTLRLVRERIGPWTVHGLEPGEFSVLTVDTQTLMKELGIETAESSKHRSRPASGRKRPQARRPVKNRRSTPKP